MSLAKEAAMQQSTENQGAKKAVKSLKRRIDYPGGTDPDRLRSLLRGAKKNTQQ